MSAPNLAILAEPAEAATVIYGELAARSSNDDPAGQLSLVLTITNNEPSPVHMNQVTVSFQPPDVSASVIAANLNIPSGGTQQWWFKPANHIILPMPAPGTINLELACDGFSEPATLNMPLVPYGSTAAGGGYSFPGAATDLNKGEYWTGMSAAHGDAGGGTQMFAYDLLVRVYDPAANAWPSAAPGADNTKNASYYIWGKPIYAIADGVVVQILDGMPANTPPGFPNPLPATVEGNHFYIQHGADLALYAHLQAGTLNPALTAGPNADGTGAAVTRGQLLGLAGNSGRSSEPHLHIQVNRTNAPWAGPPRPLAFNEVFVLDLSLVDAKAWPPNDATPWNEVTAQDLPTVVSAIWMGKLGKPPVTPDWPYIFAVFAWAWIIVIGGLMITPGGVSCTVCGRGLTVFMGFILVATGALGFVSRLAGKTTKVNERVAAPRIDVKANLDR
jgi:hypothetical protein